MTAIRGGMTTRKFVDLVREIRKFSQIPLIGMGYINNMLNYGLEGFVADVKTAGLDGLIVPDKAQRVYSFHRCTLKALSEMLSAPLLLQARVPA